MDEQQRRLTRSESDRMVAGVCGGLAEHFGLDANIIRIAFVLLTIFGGSGVVLYLAMWLIVPRASKADLPPRDVVRDAFDEGRQTARDGAEAAKRGYQRMRGTEPESRAESGTGPGAGTAGDPQTTTPSAPTTPVDPTPGPTPGPASSTDPGPTPMPGPEPTDPERRDD